MSLDDLTCDICGMRYGDVDLYHLHVEHAHQPGERLRDDRVPDVHADDEGNGPA